MRRNKKIVGYIAITLVLILVLLLLMLPALLKHFAVKQIDELTGRKSEIAKISLNPFTLSASITGLRLSEKKSAATFLTLSSARLTLSPLSLPKRSCIIKELRISSPYLHVVRNAQNSFNFSDLLTSRDKKDGTPLFSVNNIVVNNGSVDFQDKALSVEKDHRVRGIAISVPFISNMPYLAEQYVSPHLSAIVNGSPFSINGRLKPLTRAVEATVELKVKDLDIPFLLPYLPFPPPVKIDSGRLATALELGYRIDAKSGPEIRVAGTISLDRAVVKELSGQPLASMVRAELKIKNLWLLSRRFDLTSLKMREVELFATRDQGGRWNFQKIGQHTKTATDQPGSQVVGDKALDLKLAKLSITGGKVHLSDGAPKGGFKTNLSQIDLSLDDFSLAQGHKAPFALKLHSERGESATVKGELAVFPFDVKALLTLTGIPLKDYYPYLSDTLTSPVTGTLDLSCLLLFNNRQGLVVEKSTLKGKDLSARFGHGEGFTLKSAELEGIGAELKKRNAVVEMVELKGGNFILSREKDGALSAQHLLRSKKETAADKMRTSTPSAAVRGSWRKEATPPPFSYRVGKINGSNVVIRFTDRIKEEAPLFTLKRMKFSLGRITGPKQGPIPFTLASGYGNKGEITADGTISSQPLKFKGNVRLHEIALNNFTPYLPKNLTVSIVAGAMDTELSLNIEKGANGFKGSFGGSLGVRSFYCQDQVLDEELLKWERLQIGKITGTLAPFTLAIRDVSLSNFYSRIIVQKDGTLNVQHLMREDQQAAPPALTAKRSPATNQAGLQSKTLPTATGVQENAAQPYPISIDTITLQGGTLAFSDRHLEAPFDTTFFNLGGRVSGLYSQANKAADIDIRGNLENHSPLSITGVINPLRGDLYLDVKVSFKDIELSPLTPYSNTYLGYNVDQGKLSLDLTYHVEKKTLSSQNKIFIDQFTLGRKVRSAKATKLPVRLAIALLKDRKGEINLALPVVGRTDDPKFSVWGALPQILKNLLVKAATAPFTLLSSMFGGTEDLRTVYFAAGSNQIIKTEQDKLLKLSRAMHDRPTLSLEISGFVESSRDSEGYRNEMLLKKMEMEKFQTLAKQRKLPEGATPEKTAIAPEEYPLYLKAVYEKEKFPKPRNVLGLHKELPDAEMKKLILSHTVAGDMELQTLARARSEAVKTFLQKNGSLPAERLFEKSSNIYRPNSLEGGNGSRVEFAVTVN